MGIKSNEILNIFDELLQNDNDIIKYFIIKIYIEWFDEAQDHLIVTKSVTLLTHNILENKRLNQLIIYCGSNNEKLKYAVIELFNQ